MGKSEEKLQIMLESIDTKIKAIKQNEVSNLKDRLNIVINDMDRNKKMLEKEYYDFDYNVLYEPITI